MPKRVFVSSDYDCEKTQKDFLGGQAKNRDSPSYFLLSRYSGKADRQPTAAKATDKVYKWTWEKPKQLVGGGR